MSWPETPEAVALLLLTIILQRSGAEPGSNQPPAKQILDLYAECLRTTYGNRGSSFGPH
jgi:hypothetical protein